MTAAKEEDNVPDYYGHRKRLKERFMRDEGASMSEYELLELLLMLAIPRRDVKPIAKRLLLKFGDLPSVIFAKEYDLRENGRLGDSAIFMLKCLSSCITRAVGYKFMEKKEAQLLENMGMLKNFCRVTMGYKDTEEFKAFFYDNKFKYKGVATLSTGLADQTSVHIRTLAQEALLKHSTIVVLTHNHPAGVCAPSNEDIYATQVLCQQASVYGIKIWEHFIVTKSEVYSMREHGYVTALKEMSAGRVGRVSEGMETDEAADEDADYDDDIDYDEVDDDVDVDIDDGECDEDIDEDADVDAGS